MIRFACPGCAATYTVADEKAGKTGKCPKCESQFVIPAAPTPSDADVFTPPAPPPPPVGVLQGADAPRSPVAAEPVEIVPCPGCGSRLTVLPEDLGLDVECPTCARVYTAKRPTGGSKTSRPLGDGSKTSRSVNDGGSRNRPSLPPRGADDEEDDRPRRRPARAAAEDDDDDDRPRRRRDEDDDRPRRRRDEDDDRPRRRPRRRPTPGSPALGIVSLVLGIITLFGCCCWPLGIVLALGAIGTGFASFKTPGKGMGIAGMVLGILGLILIVVLLVVGATVNLADLANKNRNNVNNGGFNNNAPFAPRQQK